MPDPRATPAMQQYYRFKKRHPGCVLLFRIGDFYEMFDDDAVAVSKAIGLTLTKRTEGVPMAGLPFHQLETYLKKLIDAGFRVAVAEQLIDASQAKGLVPRAVTRVLTPGTLVDESLLDDRHPGTLAAVAFTGSGEDSPASLACVEVSTGDFVVLDCSAAQLIDELARRGVRELLYCDPGDGSAPPRVRRVLDSLRLPGTPRPAWHFRSTESREAMLEHFKVSTLAGFGLGDDDPAIAAAGVIVRYLRETQSSAEEEASKTVGVSIARATLRHVRPPRREASDAYCVIDAVSLRALEVERTIRNDSPQNSGEPDGSLLSIFVSGRGVCRTPMGKRLLRDWLCRPLRSLAPILERQNAVATLVEDRKAANAIGTELESVQDVPRIAGRLSLARATPRDVVALARSAMKCATLADLTANTPTLGSVRSVFVTVAPLITPIAEQILRLCVDEPPPHMREGGLIRDGVDATLDEVRLLQRDAGAWLAEYQASLIARHNLPSLKVGYNRVFGYYIELPGAQARSAPAELVRKQTLRNAERFTTPELREFEGKVMSAEARALDRERELFDSLCELAGAATDALMNYGHGVAQLDALLGMADKAARRGWVRPEVVEAPVLEIHGGRHPVLDESLGQNFVPNDVELGGGAASSLALITGPNMAGKSTYIRQVALLTLLAHTGSFIPADRATIGLTDRIFTRIGADDALHAGQSTFMVEMIETANILNHATARSLVVLDEIGRGTSTLDGLSLAWSIVEHLSGSGGGSGGGSENAAGPRTLFATHYHELTELEERLPGRVMNLHVAVREWPGGDEHAEIVFLHRILRGRADRSYGLHVARLAGIPANVVARARDVLASLAVQHSGNAVAGARQHRVQVDAVPQRHDSGGQFSLFTEFLPHPAVETLRDVKLDHLSPLQAFDLLRNLKEQAGNMPAKRL